jgi:hypothetical protein
MVPLQENYMQNDNKSRHYRCHQSICMLHVQKMFIWINCGKILCINENSGTTIYKKLKYGCLHNKSYLTKSKSVIQRHTKHYETTKQNFTDRKRPKPE